MFIIAFVKLKAVIKALRLGMENLSNPLLRGRGLHVKDGRVEQA